MNFDDAERDVRVTIGDDPMWTFTAAYVERRTWNGWAQPWFTEEEGRKVAAMSYADYDRDPAATQEYVEFVGAPHMDFYLINPAEDEYRIVDAEWDGERWVYGIGLANWTWEKAE